MLNIALFGPPGAGKGTQSKLLLEKFNLVYISTGDILRNEIANKTEYGVLAKKFIDEGKLVPEEMIIDLIEKKIIENPDVKGFLFDGFPRTLVQAYILEGLLLKLHTGLTVMLSLEVDDNEVVKRLVLRGKDSGRTDDAEDVIRKRLDEYHTKTEPVAQFYKEQEKFSSIPGIGEISDIFQRITESIDKNNREVWLNIVLSGPPGAGKGTQAELLAQKYQLVHLGTGEILRDEVEKNTDCGQKARKYLESGDLVPDDIVIQILEREINKHPQAKGFVFDGFPSNVIQAYILDGLLIRRHSTVSCVINLEVSILELIKRLQHRGTISNRIYDANLEVIVHRLEEYEQKAEKLAEYYQKQDKHYRIDGVGDIDEISDRICNAVDLAFRNVPK